MPDTWKTPRLLIRRFRVEDWRDLYDLQGDPEATRFIGGVWTEERTHETVKLIVANYELRELEWFAAADAGTGQVLGACWLGPMNGKWCEALGLVGPQVEVGYRFARRHWGRGYATEAATAMLRRGFEELRLPRIVSIVDVRNAASERVLQKIGMRCQRSAERDSVTVNYYSLDRHESAAISGATSSFSPGHSSSRTRK